ncbi:2-acylphloroglucinol 4-prenyltransferase isoform X1 [Cannabis sativa]|uniref:2-acylphloroglucinol 4-prenyltransferase isoform X1 n=1 Tax=Cannabis sativa TaxID=3483 RepID=UPI0011E06D75|nr:2-acylphloroglucinol 4-prenyltransferase isoform X1 [Cannabis sativa]
MMFSSVCSSLSPLGTNITVPRSNYFKSTSSSSHYYKINNKPITFSSFSSTQDYSAKGTLVYTENKFTKSFLQRKTSIRANGEIEADGSDGTTEFNVMKSGNTIWRFARPYAAKGVLFNYAALFAKELVGNLNLCSWSLILKIPSFVLVILCVTICVNGINQIYDLDIDRLNKPDLPLASGEMSIEMAWVLTIFCAISGLILTITMNSGPFFPFLYCGSIFVAGFLYSAPPFRFKNNHFTALLCNYVMFVSTTLQIYCAYKAGLGLPLNWSPAFCLLVWFLSLIAVTICIGKDLSDIEGDRKFGVTTFPTEYGAKPIALICHGLILLDYVGLMAAAIIWPQLFNSKLILLSHAFMAVWVVYQAWILEKSNYTTEACQKYYMYLWTIYSVEHILYLFM